MISYALSLFLFVKTHPHFLATLLALEFMTLILFYYMSTLYMSYGLEMFNSFFFLSVAVSEAALGLSLVVLLVRKSGKDYLPL